MPPSSTPSSRQGSDPSGSDNADHARSDAPPSASKRPIGILYHPIFADCGGGELLGAWLLQVMRQTHDVFIFCNESPDWNRIDSRFATSLAKNPPGVILIKKERTLLQRLWPTEGRLLELSLKVKHLVEVHHQLRPSLWASSQNHNHLPIRGLQYIHWPEPNRGDLACNYPDTWSWPRKLALRINDRLSRMAGMNRACPPSGHLTVTNSHWTSRAVEAQCGLPSQVVYPPVPPFAPGLPWEERANTVVLLGRWAPEKYMPLALDIVRRARQAGAELRLALVGFWTMTEKQKAEVQAEFAGHDWVDWHENLPRAEVEKFVGSCRYAVHTMYAEHFGIAVAELLTAGCVTLVHNSGGVPEIVDNSRLTYENAGQAASILMELWRSPALQRELHEKARPRGLTFSPARFEAAIAPLLRQVSAT